MDKSFMVFIAVGLGFLYFITNFVGDIQKEDEVYRNNDYNQEHKYDQYLAVDSVGRNILKLSAADEATQKAAWNETVLREEYLSLFPDFEYMKTFLKERIKGEPLQTKLLKQLADVEEKFFSGGITADQAKEALDKLK